MQQLANELAHIISWKNQAVESGGGQQAKKSRSCLGVSSLRSAFLSLEEDVDATAATDFDRFGLSRAALSTVAQLQCPAPRWKAGVDDTSQESRQRLLSALAAVASDPAKWSCVADARVAKQRTALKVEPVLLMPCTDETRFVPACVGTVLGKNGGNIKKLSASLGPRAGVIYFDPARNSFLLTRPTDNIIGNLGDSLDVEESQLAQRARQLLSGAVDEFHATLKVSLLYKEQQREAKR